MKRWQIIALILLVTVPAGIFLTAALLALWKTGWLPYVIWIVPVTWAAAYLLAKSWRRELAAPPPLTAAPHWTARDELAWKLVEATVGTAPAAAPEQFLDPHFYLGAAQQLAQQLAHHYHGQQTNDPLGPLTVPEVLAAAELALHDSGDWLRRYVPGSHLLRIDHWRLLARAPQWATWASRLWRAGSLLVDPTSFVRQLVSAWTVDSTTRELKAGILQAFYCVFLQRVGYYLIELNSGRLKLGADRYRQQLGDFPLRSTVNQSSTTAGHTGSDTAAHTAAHNITANEDAAQPLVIAVVGQVSAGKSTVINSLLGEQLAAVDILPTTSHAARYRLSLPHGTQPLELLDTVGYGEVTDSFDRQLALAQDSDLVLLVMNASHPAKDLDVRFVSQWRAALQQQLHRKPPPLIGVLSHIDRLRPIPEWSPPYELAPERAAADARPKALSIRAALEYHASLFQPPLATLVPVCASSDQQAPFGVQEYLLPAILAQLPESRAAALLRLLHQEWDSARISSMLAQIRNAASIFLVPGLLGGRRVPPR